MGTNASAKRGVPPMLRIPFPELARGGCQDLLFCQRRFGVQDGQDVLQLITKTECAAGLVKSGTGPKTAGQRLIKQPAIGKYIQRLIGCAYTYGTQGPLPISANILEGVRCISR